MNKEEMLETLESIQRKMSEARIAEYGAEDKANIFENAIILKNATQANIEVISNRLSDEQNYIKPIDRSIRYNLEDALEVCEQDEETNNKAIARYEALVEQLRNETSAGEPQANDIESALTRAEARLNSLKEQSESLQNATKEVKDAIERFDIVENAPIVDEDKKLSDENKLKILQENLTKYEKAAKLATYDHEKEIAEVIENYRTDKITETEAIDKVKEIREYMTEEFLIDDIQTRDAKNQENIEAQRICEQEIEKLEDKLSDDTNYVVPSFIVERNNRQLRRINTQIEQRDSQIDTYKEQMSKLSEDVLASDELIAETEREITKIKLELKIYGRSIDPELEKELLAKIESRESDLKYLNSVKYESLENMDRISEEIDNLKSSSRFNRLIELRDRMTETLEKRNGVDMSAKRLDEIELARLRSDLVALQNSEKYNGLSIYEDFDNILNVKEETPVDPAIAEDKDIEDFLNGLEEAPLTNEIEEETKKDTEEPLPELDEPVEDPLNLGDTRKIKFKDLGENEKLTKKAKNKTFIGFLKKWWGPVALVVAMIATAIGLKSCSKEVADKVIKNTQENPNKYENMTEDEIKDDIDSQINDEVNHVIEEQNEQVQNENIEKSTEETNENNNVDENSDDKMKTQIIAQTSDKSSTSTVVSDVSNSLPDVGSEPITNPNVQSSSDITTTTVVDDPVYDYDVNDEKSYGGFTEDSANGSNDGFVEEPTGTNPSTTPDDGFVEEPINTNPSTTPDDGFVEESIDTNTSTVSGNGSSEEPTNTDISSTTPDADSNSDNLNVTVNNGETFIVNLGDSSYELNNSSRESNSNASSFIDLNDTTNLTEDEQGAVNLEIAGDTATGLKRENPLTATDIQKIREELAAQYGAPALTQEEIDRANTEYQESTKSR